jgi:ribosome-binding factor A
VIQYLPLGGNEPSDELVEGLNEIAKHLRGPVARALRLQFAPELVFQVDHNTDQAIRVMSIIEKLAYERKLAEAPAESETSDDDSEDEK